MILLVALGVGIFFAFQMEWYSIQPDTDQFFDKTGYADYRIVSQSGFDEAARDRVAALPGMRKVSRFVCVNARNGDSVALTVTEDAASPSWSACWSPGKTARSTWSKP